jgi:phosphoglycolate phosphatase
LESAKLKDLAGEVSGDPAGFPDRPGTGGGPVMIHPEIEIPERSPGDLLRDAPSAMVRGEASEPSQEHRRIEEGWEAEPVRSHRPFRNRFLERKAGVEHQQCASDGGITQARRAPDRRRGIGEDPGRDVGHADGDARRSDGGGGEAVGEVGPVGHCVECIARRADEEDVLTRAGCQGIHRPHMKQAVLFDLDGTLLDTLEDLADSVNAVLASLGYPSHPVDAYRYFVGDGVETLMRRTLPPEAAADEALLERAMDLQRAEYRTRWHVKTRPYPGVPELLAELERRNVRMAILSNKPDPAVGEVVRHYFAAVHFEIVRGAKPGVPVKPDPGSALQVAGEMGIGPVDFIYLGDTNTDMRTALGAGMLPVGALWGFRTEKELRESGAARLIARPGDLVGLLKS